MEHIHYTSAKAILRRQAEEVLSFDDNGCGYLLSYRQVTYHYDCRFLDPEDNLGIERVLLDPGDSYSEQPYAYVAPWSSDRLDPPFRNAPFGAMRTVDELPTPDSIAHFFRLGQEQAARGAH